MARLSLPLLCLVLTLSGCHFIPPYARPGAPVADAFPGGSKSGGKAVAEVGWRDFFADSRLKQLIALALEENRDLRVAMLNVEQSRAQYRIARAGYFPTIQAATSYTRESVPVTVAPGATVSPATSSWSASLGSTAYEIDFFGRVHSLNAQAIEKYLATEEGLRNARLALVAQVATQYFTQRQLEEQLQLARQTVESVQQLYGLNKSTFDAGTTTELDLRTAETQVLTAKVNVLTYERQAAQAQNQLVLLLGSPLPSRLPAPRPLGGSHVMSGIPVGLPSALLERRPDILQAEHTLKAANANIGAARAAFFPVVSLTGSTGSTSLELSRLFGRGTGSWSFSPQITVPIFTGGLNRANLDVAKISARIEVANYQKAIQTAFHEVADCLVARGYYSRQVATQEDLVKAQQRRYALAETRFRQGVDTYLNVLSAQQDLYGSQRTLIETRFESLSNLVTLYKALGGGWK